MMVLAVTMFSPATTSVFAHPIRQIVLPGAMLLGVTLALPAMVHTVAAGGVPPLGARLLPIFYAPLLAALWGRWLPGLIVAAVGPMLHHLLFDAPTLGMAGRLAAEGVLLVAMVVGLLLAAQRLPVAGRVAVVTLAGPLAYLLAAGVVQQSVTQPITFAWPGLIVLALLGLLFSANEARDA
jgi:hypothetical protein